MKIRKTKQVSKALLLEIVDGKKQIGRCYLYLIYNQLHKRPYGFLEDLFINEDYRGQGLGSQLIGLAIAEAKKLRCYKLLATSRFSNKTAHKLYNRFGFKKHGAEFRMELK